jgi:hypothetical protein
MNLIAGMPYIEAGMKAYRDGLVILSNPYSVGSEYYRWWNEGYVLEKYK